MHNCLSIPFDKLLKNGYLASKHEEAVKVNDSTFLFNYTIGSKNKFIQIYIGESFELLNLKSDSLKIALSETENFMNTALLLLEKKGYSLARLQLVNFKKENNKLSADLSLAAENATPCAWLPAEAVITPCLSCAGVSCAMRLYAPRILYENTSWWSSRLRKT